MNTRLNIYLVLFSFTIGLVYAQADTKAATQNTWNVSGMFSAHYNMPRDEGDYTEEGALMLNVNPRALWFPINGLGIGVDADFSYFNGHFTDFNLAVGPSVAYYLKRPGVLNQLLPYAGCSFQYLMNDVDPGAEETGWSLKLGLGISPVFGGHVAVPVELGYVAYHLSSDYGGESFSQTSSRIYLECGIGAFLWKKD